MVEREIVAGGDEHNWNVAVRSAQPRLHVEAGETRHVDVENGAVETVRRERSEKILAGSESGDLVVGETQQPSQCGTNRRLVVDHGDVGTGLGHPNNLTASRVGQKLFFGLVPHDLTRLARVLRGPRGAAGRHQRRQHFALAPREARKSLPQVCGFCEGSPYRGVMIDRRAHGGHQHLGLHGLGQENLV